MELIKELGRRIQKARKEKGLTQQELNSTPFVRQYDIMFNRWGDFNAKGSTKQTIHAGIQEAGRGNHDERKDELQRNGSTI